MKPVRPNLERRYEYLFGGELQDRIAERAIAWVPLGPLEKHGEHLPWGLDGLKAHAQCLRLAERFGGVVLPAIHVAGIHDPWHKDRETERAKRESLVMSPRKKRSVPGMPSVACAASAALPLKARFSR